MVEAKITFPDGSPLEAGIVTMTPLDPKADGGKLRFDVFGYVDSHGSCKVGFNGDGKRAVCPAIIK